MQWLRFAQEDLQAAETLHREGLYNSACFHCQQSVEKGIKALLQHQGRLIPRIHSLADLLSMLNPNIFADLSQQILPLDAFYIPARYPDALFEGLPDAQDSLRALEVARSVIKQVSLAISGDA